MITFLKRLQRLKQERQILDQANRRQKLGLVWRNRKKISQMIKDYFCLPFFLLIILCLNYSAWILTCLVYPTRLIQYTYTHRHTVTHSHTTHTDKYRCFPTEYFSHFQHTCITVPCSSWQRLWNKNKSTLLAFDILIQSNTCHIKGRITK